MDVSKIWLVIIVVMVAVEALAPGLVSIWFAIGGLFALLAASLGGPFWLQCAVFGVVSVVSLILTRPLAKKYVNQKVTHTNADMIIGKECVVREKIDNINGTGAVYAGGKMWTARSIRDDVVLEAETRAMVDRIEGVKAVVRPE